MKTMCSWIGVFALLWSGIAQAQEKVLDLIPPEAGAAIAVRRVDELKKKGDEFYKGSGIQEGLRPSQLFEEGFRVLGVQGVVDETAPAALVLIAPPAVGMNRKIELNDLNLLLVAAIPFKDRDAIGERFGFKKGELQPGKIVQVKGKDRIFGLYAYVRGKHLFLGNHQKAIELAAAGKKLSAEMEPQQRQQFNQSDLLIHLGGEVWKLAYDDFARREGERLLERSADKEAKVVTAMFIAAMKDLRFATGAAHLDGGLGLNVAAAFDKDNKAAQKLLALLQTGKDSATLAGLPDGDVLVAQAAKGNGTATGLIARAVVDMALRDVLETNQIISAAERPLFVGVFGEIWQHLQGNRAAMYLNRNQQQHGLFSMIAILETQDGKQFLEEMKELMHIADGSGLKLDPKAPQKKAVDFAQLIGQLGHVNFRVREQASLKLRLAGEPALPYLEKGIKSEDLETSIRAKKLHEEIAALTAQRRKDLLSQDHFRRIRPAFALIPKAEKRAGHSVDILRIKLLKDDQQARQPMEHLLGEDWDNMRLVVHGKQLVVLLGSDVQLLEETLQNLDANKPGLANAGRLKRFYKQSAARQFELHVALDRLMRVIDPALVAPADDKNGATSSIGVAIESNQLRLDVWLPINEVRTIVQKSMPENP